EMSQRDTFLTGLLVGFFVRIAIDLVAAILAGFIWSRVRSQFNADRFRSVLNIGGILIVYALVSSAGGSGLLAVLVFGVTLANVSDDAKEPIAAPEQGVLIFPSDLSFLVRLFFFVFLGASVELIDRPYAIATALILAGLVIARVISVSSTRRVLKS